MVKVALLANGNVGVDVAETLIAHGDEVTRLYLHDPENQQRAEDIISASKCPKERIRTQSQLMTPEGKADLKNAAVDFIITVYWSHILPKELIDCAKISTVNFHPALLPINRGWYPHVHSLLDGSPFGVTLHQLAETADTGPVWAQREFFADSTDTAGTIHARLQKEMTKIFQENWDGIRSGKILPFAQDESKAIYHKKKAIDGLDHCDLEAMSARELLQRLKARNFGERAFAYFLDEKGEKVFMHLKLSKEGK